VQLKFVSELDAWVRAIASSF